MCSWRSNYEARRPLRLHELLEELDNLNNLVDDTLPPDSITILKPENANNENTDEDSGDEDLVLPSNLPGSQLRAEAFFTNDRNTQRNDVNDFNSEDDLPLSTFVAKKRKMKEKKMVVKWSEDNLQSKFPEWLDEYGPKNDNKSPLDLFRYFFDENIIEMLVNFTNIYASQKNQGSTVSEDEFYCFIGILILFYVIVSRRKMYWQNSPDANNTIVCEAISRDWFQHILSNLHCNDNNLLNKEDKFSKMRPLFDSLNIRFRLFAPEEENHSVDDSMVPYFGRHGCKQFIKGKPIRWGYKFWMGTTRLGYIVWFDPYQGSSTSLPEKYKDMGLGSSVVLQYVDTLTSAIYRPYHIFCDKFFTSLLEELKNRGIRCTGTMRENGIPSDPMETSKVMKKKSRGSCTHKTGNGEVLVCKWHDNNVVSIATNSLSVHPINKVKRYSRSEKKHIYIDQPHLIQKYNENMGGVVRADQNVGLNRISIRGKKWYFPLFCQCIDMAIQNAWQLHRKNNGKLDQLAFRRSIATNILETYKKTSRRGPSKLPQNYNEYSRYDRLG